MMEYKDFKIFLSIKDYSELIPQKQSQQQPETKMKSIVTGDIQVAYTELEVRNDSLDSENIKYETNKERSSLRKTAAASSSNQRRTAAHSDEDEESDTDDDEYDVVFRGTIIFKLTLPFEFQ